MRYDIIPDDVRWARCVNEQLQTDYHEIMLKPSVADLLPKLVYHMEEPPIDMAIPSYLVSSAARETLTVMLSGMGGDEVFAGYGRTGPMFASELAGVSPDMMCVGKGFTGGMLPMAATLVSERVFQGFLGDRARTFFYGHTFCGNPLGASVAALIRRSTIGASSPASVYSRTARRFLNTSISSMEPLLYRFSASKG